MWELREKELGTEGVELIEKGAEMKTKGHLLFLSRGRNCKTGGGN